MKTLPIVACFLALLGAGCSSPQEAATTSAPKPETKESAPAGKTATAVVAYRNAEGKILCPVMNSVIDSEKDAVDFEDYEGKRYYFCCGGCPGKFRAEPAKYAAK